MLHFRRLALWKILIQWAKISIGAKKAGLQDTWGRIQKLRGCNGWSRMLRTRARAVTRIFWRSLRKTSLPLMPSIGPMNYRLDHHHLSDPEVRNAFVLPPKPLADHLLHVYRNKVDISFPIIRWGLFMDQYRRLFSEVSINPGRRWLAVFNMVLAIGRNFCRASKQDLQGYVDDDVFFARARSLNISDTVLFGYEDLQQVQVETLMALYFLTVSRVNRYEGDSFLVLCCAFLTNSYVLENGRDRRTLRHRIRT